MPQAIPFAVAAITSAYGATVTALATVGVAALGEGAAIALATSAVNAGISAALGAAATALLAPKVGQGPGNPTDWVADPDAPIPFAFGRVGAAGNIVHRTTFGPDLMYEGFVTVLSGAGPINSFVGFTGDDQSVTFDGAGKANSSQWTGEMWMKNSLGAQPASALVSPSGLKNSAPLPAWGSGYALSGKAAYMLVLGENSKRTAYPTGEPKPLWVIEGLKLWDPRLDSTYPGGSGSCRLNTPSTWVYSTNPILCGLKWALGLWEGPTGQGAPSVDYQVGGIGAKVEGIDVAAFVSAANISDANSWSVAAYPTSDDDKAQVLDGFLQAGGAIYAQKAGRISCIQRAAPRTSIVTISATDTAGPMEFDTAASRINRINTLRPRFWSEANRWQMTAIDEVTSSTYQTEDGGKRTRGIDFPFVPGQVQCGQLAALQIAHTREGITGTIPLKPHLQRIAPGDAFTITEAGFVLNGLKCLCLNTEYDPATGVHRVTFVSETDAKYAFALGQSPDAPESPTLTPVITSYVEPPASGDWTITVRATAANGTRVPAFDLVGAVSNATATGLLVEWGLTSDASDAGNWTMAYEGPASATSVPITGMNAGAALYVAVSHRRGQNISARTLYGPLTAGGLIGTNDAAILAALARIASDGWLTAGEKPEVIRQSATINGEYAGIATQASALGITTELTTYAAAIVAMNDYLAALTPAWNDATTDTVIVPATFRGKFNDAYVTKQVVLNAIAGDLGADVAAALSRLDVIASDSWLSAGEKPEVIRQYGQITGEYTGIATQLNALGLATELTNYNTKYTALGTYLGGLSPAWNSLTTDTPIVGANFRTAFNDYYLARQAGQTAIAAKISTDATTALSRLDVIASDSWLSAGEKPEVIRQQATVNAEYAGLAARATALGITTSLTAYFNAITALNSYLGGLSPAWNSLTTDTPIVGSTFRAAFALCYSTKADLQNAITAVLDADIDTALSRLDTIASDSILSAGEKPQIIREWEVISGEYTGFATQLNVLGLSTELTNYNNAINALSSYLSSLSPAWNSTTTNTPIVAADFRTAFRTYYLAKDAGRNAMANVNPPVAVTASTGAVGGTRTGTGTVTSNTVTASITGGTSGATIRWTISGTSAVTPTAPDSFTSAFTATITALGQSFEVIAVPFVTKGGRTYPGQPVNVSLSENA